MNNALCAGTFDPPTNGHLFLVANGLRLFDKIVVAVNAAPTRMTLFSTEERVKLWNECAAMIHAESIGVTIYHGGFPVQVARHNGCSFLLRGLRSHHDHQEEMTLARVSYDLEPGVKLVYLMDEPDVAHITSTLVRQLVGTENWKETVKKYVSVPVWEALLTKAKSIRHQALQP